MNMEIDEVVLRSAMRRKHPMDKDRLQMVFTFVQILVAEVCVFIFAVVVILAMAGFFSR
ncbi:MAG: hypothetical protein HFH88_17295 [Lachnospiraceae bacterium]|nr:hypothetical protein [Lachnospiraceae bacterium]